MEQIRGFSGVVLVTRDGKDLLRASAGASDFQTGGALCTPDTRFQIASVSKQFAATAAMILAEQGELSLGDPISQWLANCPTLWRDLTLHQLLSHTSGLGHWRDHPDFDINQPGDADELLDRFSNVPMLSTPGSKWHYSGPGYLLTARIIEQVSGQGYAQFLTGRVLQPLGLTSTCVGETPSEAVAYGYRNGSRVDAPEFAALPGSCDVWSTVGDLVRFTAAFNSDALLTARSREAMVASQASLAGACGTEGPAIADSYGYGFFLGTLAGRAAHFHFGDNPGYQSFLAWLPDLKVTVAVLCNNEETSIDDVLRQLQPAVTGS
ncbi:serine hydrolase domain-containing protein [Streptomyces sp. NPDC001820]|uniref:serine hydrolase domain-containing protein n=1 Tax=Streptomyces sp. NPDC001820 TaxID=3364613 RepID=UPI0036B68D45